MLTTIIGALTGAGIALAFLVALAARSARATCPCGGCQ